MTRDEVLALAREVEQGRYTRDRGLIALARELLAMHAEHEAKLRSITRVLEANGCDCEDWQVDDEPEDRCLAHRVEHALTGGAP